MKYHTTSKQKSKKLMCPFCKKKSAYISRYDDSGHSTVRCDECGVSVGHDRKTFEKEYGKGTFKKIIKEDCDIESLIDRLEQLTEIKDIEDAGLGGKEFEKIFVKALRLVDMKFQSNIASGPGWDIRPMGDNWVKLISDKDVNIKVHGTKWMLSSSEIYRALPWDNLPDDFDRDKAEKKVRKILNSKGVAQIYFLKPKSKDIQKEIVSATQAEDIDAIKKLLVKKNFLFEKLGKGYGVRILDNGERVTSVAILKDGKVFMRSEKPRKLGGAVTVTFRAPTPKISKIDRKVVNKFDVSD